jgi:hypothetical protein
VEDRSRAHGDTLEGMVYRPQLPVPASKVNFSFLSSFFFFF